MSTSMPAPKTPRARPEGSVSAAQLAVQVVLGDGLAVVEVPCIQEQQHTPASQDPAWPEVPRPNHRPHADQEDVDHRISHDASTQLLLPVEPLPLSAKRRITSNRSGSTSTMQLVS